MFLLCIIIVIYGITALLSYYSYLCYYTHLTINTSNDYKQVIYRRIMQEYACKPGAGNLCLQCSSITRPRFPYVAHIYEIGKKDYGCVLLSLYGDPFYHLPIFPRFN